MFKFNEWRFSSNYPKTCDFIGNNPEISRHLKRLDGKKLTSKLLVCGLKQSINYINNTSRSTKLFTHDEMTAFDNWFSVFTHLYHEQEENEELSNKKTS